MNSPNQNTPAGRKTDTQNRRLGTSIAIGLTLGIACGMFLGDYCQPLQAIGDAYVGLLQMTVLPYLVLSLIGKLGRLDVAQARRLGLTALAVLLCFWLVAITLIVLVSTIFPDAEGAAFYSPRFDQAPGQTDDLLTTVVPSNVFRSLTLEYVPAVVVFCLFFGSALMMVPGKEKLIDLLDLSCEGISRINVYLVKLAPFGLFALSAAAAGTLRIDQLSRLQAYLIVFSIACAVAAFGAIPLLVSSLTNIRYRDLMRAASEPMLTAIATGKLFVVLPQIVENCEALLVTESTQPNEQKAQAIDPTSGSETAPNVESTPSVLVPLAYSFPHTGKILAFVFIAFAGWYSGNPLQPGETFVMAATGTMSSFASPLVSIPYLLDQYELPQDLMAMFILPGFITTRMADVVGVMHLMALTVIVSQALQRRVVVQWARLAAASTIMLACLFGVGLASRLYLASTSVVYDLDQRLLSLKIGSPLAPATVYESTDALAQPGEAMNSSLERLRNEKILRVGYHPDHIPYSYFNSEHQLVGMDVEMMHRLAIRLGARLEFIPYEYQTVLEQLNAGQFDVVIGGMMINPERLLRAGFTQPYLDVTLAIAAPDHHRDEFRDWQEIGVASGLRLGVLHEDIRVAAHRHSPESDIVVINSIRDFFENKIENLDGFVIPAEEGAAWNVLYPNHAIVIPQPVARRPIGMAVRSGDSEWRNFLDRWIDFEMQDGTLQQLRSYWIEGGGTEELSPRWSIARDYLHWLP